MYPTIADYGLNEPLDFERLRNEVVTGQSFVPSFGQHSDLQTQIQMLEHEFAGQSRLKLVHAVLIVLLRRGVTTDIVYSHFHALWLRHGDLLLETLDSRWLVSACDTICDHSIDPTEAKIAVLLSLFINTLKLTETERRMIVSTEVDKSRIVGRVPLFDGMTAFTPGKGDMPANMLRRVDRALEPGTLTGMIGRELISRALSADSLFSRFGKMATDNAWRPYMSPVDQGFSVVPRIETPAARRSDQAGYILLNDTGRLGGSFHLGTVYACTAIRQGLACRGLQEIGWANDRAQFDFLLSTAVSPPTLVVLNGEGTLHHGSARGAELLSLCTKAKEHGIGVAVVNSVWEANTDDMLVALRMADLIHLRDSVSRNAIPGEVAAEITPDMSIHLFLRTARGGQFSPPQHQLGVMDSVVPSVTEALLGFAEQESLPFYAMPGSNLRNIRNAVAARSGPVWPRLLQLPDLFTSQAWVTGRFHGLIAALCAGLPVCAVQSNTAKVEGLLEDANLAKECLLDSDWLAMPNDQKRRELSLRFKMQQTSEFIQRRESYLEMAAVRIEQMFDNVAELAHGNLHSR